MLEGRIPNDQLRRDKVFKSLQQDSQTNERRNKHEHQLPPANRRHGSNRVDKTHYGGLNKHPPERISKTGLHIAGEADGTESEEGAKTNPQQAPRQRLPVLLPFNSPTPCV